MTTTIRTLCLWAACLPLGIGNAGRAADLTYFPVVTQFTPVPSGKGWKGEEGPLDEAVIRDTIDNLREHGFTGIEAPTHRPPDEEAKILRYAQEQGMFVSYHAGFSNCLAAPNRPIRVFTRRSMPRPSELTRRRR